MEEVEKRYSPCYAEETDSECDELRYHEVNQRIEDVKE